MWGNGGRSNVVLALGAIHQWLVILRGRPVGRKAEIVMP